MKVKLTFPILIVSVLSLVGCDRHASENRTKSQYDKFLTVPKYVAEPSREDSAFFATYQKAMDLWPIDFQHLFVPTSHGTAHVILAGPSDGKPLVLLHGLHATSAMWYPNVEALAEHYRLFAIDLLVDPGLSEETNEVKNNQGIIDWYHEIFNQLELDTLSIVGASRGGWLAVHIALAKKVHVEKLVLLSPAQTFEMTPPSAGIFSNLIYEMAPNRERLRRALSKLSTHPEKIKAEYLDLFHLCAKRGKIDHLVASMMPLAPKKMKALHMPVLLLIGDEDELNGSRSLHTAELLVPNVQTTEIEDAGHFLSIDQAEEVNRRMVEFLTAEKPLATTDTKEQLGK